MAVLADVFVVPFAKECLGSMEVFGVKRQCVELVITHDGQSFFLFHHWPNNLQHLPDLWPSVDEVAKKDHFAFGVLVNTVLLLVAKNRQQLNQFVSVAVDVANQVVHLWRSHRGLKSASVRRRRRQRTESLPESIADQTLRAFFNPRRN